jgi:hypothetical protein
VQPIHVDIVLNTDGTPTSRAEILVRCDPGVLEIIDVDAASEGAQVSPGALYATTFINEVYTDEVDGSSGLMFWDTVATNVTLGVHRIAFAIKDYAGNWSIPGVYVTYDYGRYVYFPLVVRAHR